MTQGRAGPEFSAALTALGLSSGLIPSPSGLGSRLVAALRALYPWRFWSFFFLNLPHINGRPERSTVEGPAFSFSRYPIPHRSATLPFCHPEEPTCLRQVEKEMTPQNRHGCEAWRAGRQT